MWNAVIEDEPTETVRLVSYDPDGETRVLEAIVFGNSTHSHDEAQKRVEAMSAPSAPRCCRRTSAIARIVDTVPVELRTHGLPL